jgi:hypothetical protein
MTRERVYDLSAVRHLPQVQRQAESALCQRGSRRQRQAQDNPSALTAELLMAVAKDPNIPSGSLR